MKRILLIIPLLALAVCSCVNELDYISDQDSEFIVLNASLRTDETSHAVWLSHSKVDGIRKLSGAQLCCYINGVLVAKAEEEKTGITEIASKYTFSAEIRPGDEVYLEASRDGLEASATVVAPRTAQILDIDTTRIDDSPYYFGYPTLACKLQLQDIPDQPDWYRISVHYDEQEIGVPKTFNRECDINFGFTQDPILSGGDPSVRAKNYYEDDLFNLTGTTKLYCMFQDTGFSDKTAEVEIHIMDRELDQFNYSYPQYYESDGELPPRERNLRFDFLSITKEEYDYLVQYEKSVSSYEPKVLQEPVHIPSNVEGGLGFVSIASVSSRTISL